jgi:hypothetical protein
MFLESRIMDISDEEISMMIQVSGKKKSTELLNFQIHSKALMK